MPHMRKQREGLIINVSSQMGEMGLPFCGYYCAAKFAINGLSEALLGEGYLFGIKVSVVEPMGYGTEFLGRSLKLVIDPEKSLDYKENYKDFIEKRRNFVNKKSDPQEVADKIAGVIKQNGKKFKVNVGKMGHAGMVLSNFINPKGIQKLIRRVYGFKNWFKKDLK